MQRPRELPAAPRRRRLAAAPRPRPGNRTPPPLAVIDVGSNSGRVTVMRLHRSGTLEVLADARAPLRLARDVAETGRLGRAAIERTLAALHDFRAIALGAGATSILAVATSAVREATNGAELIERVRRELGLALAIVDGEREAAFAYLGAVHGLPVDHGLLLDLGGGSLEVSQFRDRKLLRTWTLPLGALRVSDRFLASDPPSAAQIRRLTAHVTKTLRAAGIPRLADDELLLGTGGTVRNIANIDARVRRDPLARIHGWVLDLARVRALGRRAGRDRQSARAAIPGLNKDRADSIVGGLVVLQRTMEHVGAEHLQVSGQGLREGIALATLGKSPAPARAVRQASIEALVRRFATCRRDVARRRVRIARRLLDILEPRAGEEMREVLDHVCTVLDVGRSVDYYDRHRNAAMIVLAADLQGFAPRGIALLYAVLVQADRRAHRLKSLRPVLRPKDGKLVDRVAVLLLLADEIERRSLPGHPVHVRHRLGPQAFGLAAESLRGWRPRALADRFRHAFGRELRVGPA